MRFGNDLSSKIGRILISIFMLLLSAGIIGIVIEGNIGDYSLVVAPILFYVMIYGWYETASGTLTEEGIYIRHFIIKRFYRWSDIRQVGIVHRQGRHSYYEIVLVKPCGSLRTPETKGFLFRNQFRLIHITYSEPVRLYIISCYGKLDFDERGVW
jgi:hypothetical protein